MINLFYPYPRFDECCFYPISNEFYPYFMKNEFTHILRSTSFTRSLGYTNPIVCLLLYPTYCIPSIFTVKLCWHNETSVYDSISPRIVFFQSARSGPDCPRWINCFDWHDCRPEAPPVVPVWSELTCWKTVVPWSSWSSEDLVRVGCLHSVDTTHDPR